jgi:two-component system sensor histidine kinase KdpD
MIGPDHTQSQDFLELVEGAKRGKLKLYIGFAAGVGKTFRMLEEARLLRQRGVDVVIGLVETHGRPETDALLAGLEVVARRKEQYRGIFVEDLDVDAVLARKPTLVVVDEIAHTNVPGGRNRKRYEDVLELLDAGVNVIGAMNVQHLDSLKDVVHRATGLVVRENVPDRFLTQAAQIVNVDLSVEDLLERLQAGKVYAPELVTGALENFFRNDNLAVLRELALREVAGRVEKGMDRHPRGASLDPLAPDRGRVMVCLSSYPPRAMTLLRRGSRAAGRLHTDWFVVYVETPHEAPEVIDLEAQRHLLANFDLARELGAEIVRLRARDPVAASLDFARSHGIGLIIVGRSHRPWYQHLFGRSFPSRLLHEAREFDVHFVATPGEGDSK